MSNIGQIMAECGCQHSQCGTLGYCMAARIIELEAEVTDMHEGLTTVYWSGYEDGKKAMEAKLAKVVEGLEKACTTLAKLTEEKA